MPSGVPGVPELNFSEVRTMHKDELLAVIDDLFHTEDLLYSDIDYVRGLRDGLHIALETVKEYIEKNWP